MSVISKVEFVRCIDDIARDERLLQKINDLFCADHRDVWLCGVSDVAIRLIEVLEKMFDDKDHWISWFCWENDFGEGDGYWWDQDGNEGYIKTAGELYDFLTNH
jgi:hypothetical protein